MKLLFSILASALLLFSFAQKDDAPIDLTKSSLAWNCKKVTGEHSGGISLSAADLDFDGDKLIAGSFSIDMKTITCSDLGNTMATKLIGHLESEDFFNVAEYPKAHLKFINVKNIEGNSYLITANLEIKGVSHPIEFSANVREHEAIATIKVDRTKYDIKYGSASFFDTLGDKAIDDIFEVKVKLAY